MSLAGYRSIPIDSFGSLVSRVSAKAVSLTNSVVARNVHFKAKGVRTRNGLSLTALLPSRYQVTGGGVLITQTNTYPIFLGSDDIDGTLYKEAPEGSGTVAPIKTGLSANVYLDMANAYSRAFMAIGDLITGVDTPQQYDGIAVSNIGVSNQSLPITLSASATAGAIAIGTRYAVVLYGKANGYISGVNTSAVSAYTAPDGSHKVDITGLPISSDPDVNQRLVCFTTSGGDQNGPYFYIPDDDLIGSVAMTKTIVMDNTSTTASFNFTDEYLQGTEDITSPLDFFDKIPLPKQTSVFYSPTTRRLIWTGGEDDRTIFRVSEVDDPETYMGSTGFVKPAQNDNERAITSREFRSQLYLFKEHAGFLAFADNVNPSGWTIDRRWERVGPVGPWAVDVSEAFMMMLDKSGLYMYDGSVPLCISDEISSSDSPLWSRINWSIENKFWVFIDTDLDEVHIGVALDQSTTCSHILKLSYLLGFKVGQRKWSVDEIPASRVIQVDRLIPPCPNPETPIDSRISTSQILYLSSLNDGAVNLLDPSSYMDNGNAINSRLQTGYYEEPGVLQLGGVGLDLSGVGEVTVAVLRNQNKKKTLNRTIPVSNEPEGIIIRATGNNPWWAVEVNNGNNPGDWFELTKGELLVRTIFRSRRSRATGGSQSNPNDSVDDSESEGGSSSSTPSAPALICSTAQLLIGTHSDRPDPSTVASGSQYVETDRGFIAYADIWLNMCDASSAVWVYQSGTMKGGIYPIDQKPVDLGLYDDGFTYKANGFNRSYIWNGIEADWNDAPGQAPRGVYLKDEAPIEEGWALCDGSTSRRSTYNGDTESFTLDNLITGTYPKFNNTYTGPTPIPSNGSLVTGDSGLAGGGVPITFSGTTDVNNQDHTHVFDITLPDHNHPGSTGEVDDVLNTSDALNDDGDPWYHTHLVDDFTGKPVETDGSTEWEPLTTNALDDGGGPWDPEITIESGSFAHTHSYNGATGNALNPDRSPWTHVHTIGVDTDQYVGGPINEFLDNWEPVTTDAHIAGGTPGDWVHVHNINNGDLNTTGNHDHSGSTVDLSGIVFNYNAHIHGVNITSTNESNDHTHPITGLFTNDDSPTHDHDIAGAVVSYTSVLVPFGSSQSVVSTISGVSGFTTAESNTHTHNVSDSNTQGASLDHTHEVIGFTVGPHTTILSTDYNLTIETDGDHTHTGVTQTAETPSEGYAGHYHDLAFTAEGAIHFHQIENVTDAESKPDLSRPAYHLHTYEGDTDETDFPATVVAGGLTDHHHQITFDESYHKHPIEVFTETESSPDHAQPWPHHHQIELGSIDLTITEDGGGIFGGISSIESDTHDHDFSGATGTLGDHFHGPGDYMTDGSEEPQHLDYLPYYRL